MKRSEIVQLFETHKIKTRRQAESFGLDLVLLGSGAYRRAYAINKLDPENRLVVKFPIGPDGLEHSRTELENFKKVRTLRKYRALLPFMPNILYANKQTGVILMEYYWTVRYSKAKTVADVLRKVTNGMMGRKEKELEKDEYCDVMYYNVRQTLDGDFKIVDLGML